MPAQESRLSPYNNMEGGGQEGSVNARKVEIIQVSIWRLRRPTRLLRNKVEYMADF